MTRINIVYKAPAPEPPYPCELVDIEPKFVPMLLGGIWLKSQVYFSASVDDWNTNRQMLAQEGAQLLMPCGTDVVNALHELYSLTDTIYRGVQRSDAGIDEDTGLQLYDPPINPFPNPGDFVAPGVQHSNLNIDFGLQNLINGTENGPYGQTEQVKQQLQEIITLLQGLDTGGIDYTSILLDILAALG